MRMVGTVALDVGRVPGATAVALACDVSAAAVAAGGRLRVAASTIVRGVASVLRVGGPAVAALVTSFRALPTSWIPDVSPLHGRSDNTRRTGAQPSLRPAPDLRPSDDGSRQLALPADATAPGLARAFLRRVTRDWEVSDDVVEDAAMVTTELVANAVDHAHSASTLSLRAERGSLCVTVRDALPGPLPRLAPIDPTAPRGRGLQMVDALSTAWGVSLHADGKSIWAVLDGA